MAKKAADKDKADPPAKKSKKETVGKKEKSKASKKSNENCEQIILQYLKKQNRPYSAMDIFNNLHGSVGKTQIVKVLTNLQEKNEITCKNYGKQQVYVIKQDDEELPSPDELDSMDQEITDLKKTYDELKEEIKFLSANLSSLNSSMTMKQLEQRSKELDKENMLMEKKLEDLRSGTRKIDPVQKAQVDKNHAEYTKLWKARKRMCMEVVDMVLENLPMKKAEFFEELGMENDPM